MDGMELVGCFRLDEELRRIPVIMQTGADQPELVRQGIDVGVFYYLTNPFDDNV